MATAVASGKEAMTAVECFLSHSMLQVSREEMPFYKMTDAKTLTLGLQSDRVNFFFIATTSFIEVIPQDLAHPLEEQ